MFHFYYPWAALLFFLPILLLLIPKKKTSQDSLQIYFPYLEKLKSAFPNFSETKKTKNWLCWTVLYLSWAFLVLALMQPEKEDQFTHVKNKGYDLMLAVDISGSMQAVDFSTPAKLISRLDATKEVVGKFVLGRKGDRVGLVTFGEHAYLHVPLTLDTLSVSKMLNYTVSGMAGNATAIGDAIGLSVRVLKERPEGSRILILLTDGDDNASSIPPLEAAKLAKQYGVKIYTIGVGKNGSVPFPNGIGGYQMAQVTMDEELLKEISRMTGGQYFLATNQNILSAIYKKIDQMEKTESDENIYLIKEPLYHYPLGAAAFLLFMLSLSQILDRRSLRGT